MLKMKFLKIWNNKILSFLDLPHSEWILFKYIFPEPYFLLFPLVSFYIFVLNAIYDFITQELNIYGFGFIENC